MPATERSISKKERTSRRVSGSPPVIRTLDTPNSVATRISRLTYLAREKPEQPSETEFSQDEIDATILLRRPPTWKPGQKPTLGRLVGWIAELGGYTGKSSGGPPGATVIGLGLERVKTAAELLAGAKQLGLSLAPEKR